MNFTQEQYIILGAIALAAFLIGSLITWAITSGRAKTIINQIKAEKASENQRVEDTKQRLTSSQKDLQALRNMELTIKQELSSLRSENKSAKEFNISNQSILEAIHSIEKQLNEHINSSQKPKLTENFLEPFPGGGDFADLATPPTFTTDSTLNSEFEGFTADTEGSGI